MEGNCQGVIVLGGNFLGAIVWGVIVLGRNFLGAIVWGEIVLGRDCPGAIVEREVVWEQLPRGNCTSFIQTLALKPVLGTVCSART